MADEEFENFAGGFLLSLMFKKKFSVVLKIFLFLHGAAAFIMKSVLVAYVVELGRKYMVQKRTWNNDAMKVPGQVRMILEFIFVCRCCLALQRNMKLFANTPSVPWPLRLLVIAPRFAYSLVLMVAGVSYLVAVSFDNVEGVMLDALTFELIFDMETLYYQWTMSEIHDQLMENRDDKPPEDPIDEDFVYQHHMFVQPFLRLSLSIGLTYALDYCAVQVANSKDTDDFAHWCMNQLYHHRIEL